MTIELTNEEKLSIVNQHIKNLRLGQYGLELTTLELQAAQNPDLAQIESLALQIADINAKITLLEDQAVILAA